MIDNQAAFRPAGGANIATVSSYIARLFGGWDWNQGGCIALRGIGEKGTPKEGVFRENKFIDARNPFYLSQIETHVNRWGQNAIASFIMPAIISDQAVADNNVTEDKVRAFTALCVDIDSGNVEEKLDHCCEWMGEPSFVVKSGGQTELAHDKVHAYWCLNEPTEAIAEVGRLRKLLALKVGGDPSFGRPAQVIRIPGSIYGKGGVHKPVVIALDSGLAYDFNDLADAIEGMEWMDGCEPPELAQVKLPMPSEAGGMDFSGGAGKDLNRLEGALTTPVSAGGEGEETRWGRFNQVAGHYIHCVREGKMGIEEARELVYGWMVANMNPPWPEPRFAQEWTGLLNKDMKEHGAFAPPPPPGDGLRIDAASPSIETIEDLMSWDVRERSHVRPEPRKVLVEGLVFSAKRHMFVAEGAAGKTFLLMELALKLAAASRDRPQWWLGQRILPEAEGGHVILITGEDDQEELDQRWHSIDPDFSLRAATEGRLIALPMDNLGGAFPLVAQHPHTREAVPSERWLKLYRAIKEIQNRGGWVSAIIIDTLNSTLHGEENSATVIGEYIRAVAPICGELKAAMIVSHHIRKVGNEPIRDLDDMKAAIRGSTALPNAMRVVIGMWHAHDWKRQMEHMAVPPARNKLYCAGVLKSNLPAFEGVKYLLRDERGRLNDATTRVASAKVNNFELRAWLEFGIRYYHREGMFFSATGKDNGLFRQKDKFHPKLAALPKSEIEGLANELTQSRRLFKGTVENGGGQGSAWLYHALDKDAPRHWHEKGAHIEPPEWEEIGWYDPDLKIIKSFDRSHTTGE